MRLSPFSFNVQNSSRQETYRTVFSPFFSHNFTLNNTIIPEKALLNIRLPTCNEFPTGPDQAPFFTPALGLMTIFLANYIYNRANSHNYILWPRWQRQYVPPEPHYLPSRLYDICISIQKKNHTCAWFKGSNAKAIHGPSLKTLWCHACKRLVWNLQHCIIRNLFHKLLCRFL
jgi:hypothetical protein